MDARCDIFIRPLQENDSLSQLQHLFSQIPNAREINHIAEVLLSGMFDSMYQCHVMIQDGRLIGFGAITMHFVPSRGWTANITDVVIDYEMRSQGLGQIMINYLTKIVMEKTDFSIIELHYELDQAHLDAVCIRLGFDTKTICVSHREGESC
jgi:ribosomal protein S18 acetylase RimI-like enzyme